MASHRVIVIGAGVGGLAASIALARAGLNVTVVERAAGPGGKLRTSSIGGQRIDAGPTVLTMRGVFDEIFSSAGASLGGRLTLEPLETLARHAWSIDERLDLFSDIERSADAIGDFAGAQEARGYRAFCADSRRMFATLENTFIRAPRPGPLSLAARGGLAGLGDLWRIKPFATLWSELGAYFRDPRLRQLFARYATYCGSSPFLAPATLMLVAHAEQSGVWTIEGGMHALAAALTTLARENGVAFRFAEHVSEIAIAGGRACGVVLETRERLSADAIVCNGDASALAGGLFGAAATRAATETPEASRSLSAVTWAMIAKTDGFPLAHHNVFFSENYAAEFEDIFQRSQLPSRPTVYVCAQDRAETNNNSPQTRERLLCLVNAPPVGDRKSFEQEIGACEKATFATLQRCGLRLDPTKASAIVTTPSEFAALYPATGGALYGPASHGWKASFARPGARSKIPGLYLAGGSVHPGPGLPMAALSGRQAAASILADLASGRTSRKTATHGGIWTR